MRKRGMLVWGIIILLIWLACSLGFAALMVQTGADFLSGFVFGQTIGFIFFLLGLILFLIGFFAELKASRFNRRDIAQANALHHRLVEFAQTPRQVMYSVPDDVSVSGARIIEIERHFDQQTEGAITGAMETSMRMFATSFGASSSSTYATGDDTARSFGTSVSTTSGSLSGTTIANLSLSQTTRANLMGDALFAVFEVDGNDTYRVVSMSAPGVRDWMAEMITAVSEYYGGQATHSGGVVAAWVPTLTQNYGPQDVSYATDRLKALAARPYEDRDEVLLSGTTIGRNAMIATHMRIGEAAPLELLPAAFPSALGAALGTASAGAVGAAVAAHAIGPAETR
ncbi:hypothetical protein [Microbacterium sp. NIBRBAC000506063]|uniref:hypothetical protein n=1 Tax=Microbacterium sp. NIBRBAC000506063 TaxID=2734618 RepID=UPI001BB52176|nr:hypothetical protein [Microbacterium sp. NIBRBAC000506063]QTV79807.1 hypothetical protein KAE78_00655 [Microbacterium sp. NIBRBAC000506063]